VSSFERGEIYWWPDVGAIELGNVVVQFTGLHCFGETDWDQSSNSDEPYAVIGVLSPIGTSTYRSQVYQDVDGGESRSDQMELYKGKPAGLVLSVILNEHDFADPQKYSEIVKSSAEKAFEAAKLLISLIPKIGPVLSEGLGVGYSIFKKEIENEIQNTLHFGDDELGTASIALSEKQMVVLAARTARSSFRGVTFKLETPLLSKDGASYKVCFNIEPA
jgi:hypothetical protein